MATTTFTAPQATPYPVRVDARLDPDLSRWLWLVKWVLAIPHYVVLFFLWIGFAVLSVVAFFAILLTGRYPRSIFDFNVGVLRWSWRVAYYAYGTLGTDRYPPFTLADAPDFPAHFDVDYPEHLSRGLALVKWWLLAIPHYLVVGIFLGGGTYVVDEVGRGTDSVAAGTGLIGVLVLVAGVVLLFTGRYPGSVFDLLLGLNRWVLRVAAYAGLMTDRYPPFRLDQGGDDPDHPVAGPVPDPGSAHRGLEAQPAASSASATATAARATARVPSQPAVPRPSRSWTAGRIVAVTGGSVAILLSLGTGLGGATALLVDQVGRDDAGFVSSRTQTFATETYALTSETMTIHLDGPAAVTPESILGDVRVDVEGVDGRDLFVGVAHASDVADFLGSTKHAEVVDLRSDGEGGLDPVYRVHGSTAPLTAPGDADIWVAQATGQGPVTVEWAVEEGDWTLLVMNADRSARVQADVSVAASLPWLDDIAVGLLVAAAVLLALGTLTVGLALRRHEEGDGA
jgi:hypothetical protein